MCTTTVVQCINTTELYCQPLPTSLFFLFIPAFFFCLTTSFVAGTLAPLPPLPPLARYVKRCMNCKFKRDSVAWFNESSNVSDNASNLHNIGIVNLAFSSFKYFRLYSFEERLKSSDRTTAVRSLCG